MKSYVFLVVGLFFCVMTQLAGASKKIEMKTEDAVSMPTLQVKSVLAQVVERAIRTWDVDELRYTNSFTMKAKGAKLTVTRVPRQTEAADSEYHALLNSAIRAIRKWIIDTVLVDNVVGLDIRSSISSDRNSLVLQIF